HFQHGVLEAELRVARDGIEAPIEFTAFGVIRGNVATYAHLGAAVADQHLAFHDTRRTRDGVGLAAVDGVHVPQLVAAGGVECHQASVEGADIDLAFPPCDTTIHHVAAGIDGPLTRD